MIDTQKYRLYCDNAKNIPVFSMPWYLDAVAGTGAWDAIVIEEGGNVVGTMPFVRKSKFGISVITQPVLTQKLGVTFHNLEGLTYNKRLSTEKRVLDVVIKNLPSYRILIQTFDHKFTNWLPFYWLGFKQTTRYSYRIDDISDAESVAASFAHAKRKDLKKASKVVEIYPNLPPEEFYENHKSALAKQGLAISYDRTTLFNIFQAGRDNDSLLNLYAEDAEGNIHGTFLIVYDEECAYFLISSIDPDFRNSGSTALLLKSSIERLKGKTKAFDFEGSMIEPVEFSFRQFGGQQKQLFEISHVPNRFLRAALVLAGRM